jgi:hypothetical protein
MPVLRTSYELEWCRRDPATVHIEESRLASIRMSLLETRMTEVHAGHPIGLTWYGGGRDVIRVRGIRAFGYTIAGYTLEELVESLTAAQAALGTAPR